MGLSSSTLKIPVVLKALTSVGVQRPKATCGTWILSFYWNAKGLNRHIPWQKTLIWRPSKRLTPNSNLTCWAPSKKRRIGSFGFKCRTMAPSGVKPPGLNPNSADVNWSFAMDWNGARISPCKTMKPFALLVRAAMTQKDPNCLFSFFFYLHYTTKQKLLSWLSRLMPSPKHSVKPTDPLWFAKSQAPRVACPHCDYDAQQWSFPLSFLSTVVVVTWLEAA